MKHLLLTLAVCLLFSVMANSQITLNRPNYFTLGKAYPYAFLNNIKIDSVNYTGMNCTWDLSSAMYSGDFDTLYAIDPTGTIFYNEPLVNYNLSNLCLYAPYGDGGNYDDSLYSYYIDNVDSVFFIGMWAYNGVWETAYYHLTNFELVFTFPLSYGNIFTDGFNGSFYDFSGFGNCLVNGTRTVEVVGQGILKMPGTTFYNALKVKSHRTGTYACGFGNSFNDTYYTWFDLNRNGPVLEMYTTATSVSGIKYFYENPLINGINEFGNNEEINIFPNPTSDKLIIQSIKGFSKCKVYLTDSNGRLIYMDDSANIYKSHFEIDLNNISRGIYCLFISDENTNVIKKIIKI